MNHVSRRGIVTTAFVGIVAVGLAGCDGNAQDDLENIEENVEEGATEVGEAVEEGGEELQGDDEDGEG